MRFFQIISSLIFVSFMLILATVVITAYTHKPNKIHVNQSRTSRSHDRHIAEKHSR